MYGTSQRKILYSEWKKKEREKEGFTVHTVKEHVSGVVSVETQSK